MLGRAALTVHTANETPSIQPWKASVVPLVCIRHVAPREEEIAAVRLQLSARPQARAVMEINGFWPPASSKASNVDSKPSALASGRYSGLQYAAPDVLKCNVPPPPPMLPPAAAARQAAAAAAAGPAAAASGSMKGSGAAALRPTRRGALALRTRPMKRVEVKLAGNVKQQQQGPLLVPVAARLAANAPMRQQQQAQRGRTGGKASAAAEAGAAALRSVKGGDGAAAAGRMSARVEAAGRGRQKPAAAGAAAAKGFAKQGVSVVAQLPDTAGAVGLNPARKVPNPTGVAGIRAHKGVFEVFLGSPPFRYGRHSNAGETVVTRVV